MNSVADIVATRMAKLNAPLRLPPDALEIARARCVTHGVPTIREVREIERQAYAAGFWAGAAAGAEAVADIARMTEDAK